MKSRDTQKSHASSTKDSLAFKKEEPFEGTGNMTLGETPYPSG